MMDNKQDDGLPGNSPEENTRIENELLKLKLQAELGVKPHLESGLPPEVENLFLKNVLAFEHATANAKQVKVYNLLGNPKFKRSDELNGNALEQALDKIKDLLHKKNIEVSFSGTYDSRTQYTFLTEELFEHQTDDILIPGMVKHFSYEEFHPNHKLDIENRTVEFLSGWFEQSLNEQSWELSDPLIFPDGKTITRAAMAEKLKRIFDSYSAFTDCRYFISDIHFELHEDTGMGHAEGAVKYTAILENKETLLIEGPFKLYLSLDYDWWNIVYFVFPGFE